MKTALVTGASGGIGLAIVKSLIKEGYFVLGAFNKNAKPLEDLKKELEKDNLSDYLFFDKVNLEDEKEIETFYKKFIKGFSHIDLLVNNAGVDYFGAVNETENADYDKVFKVNMKAPFILTKLAVKSMLEKKSGKIINVSSIWGKVGGSYESVYSASKSALIGFTKAVAKEVAENGIQVNCICPGVIDTKMNNIFSKTEMQEIINKTPLKRIGNPNEVADLVTFLASEKANFITGEVITIDGGFAL